ncbi:protein S100-A10b [Xiphophorus hellerii]|uniref:S100 calcium binding protein A10b n=2 Tax=Xiphophorus TaxID=8082 RepID=A0A3B5PUE7_XIPMA|nr:protein S100-A1-like [Xiphophorus hellerii]
MNRDGASYNFSILCLRYPLPLPHHVRRFLDDCNSLYKLSQTSSTLHCNVSAPSRSDLCAAAMTELEKSMESLITVFHRYAKEGGNKTTLSKKELKKLIENELPNFLTTQKNPDTVSCIIKDLDQNKDDELDFEEFVPFVAGLTIACEKHFALHHEKKGKK